MPFFSVKWTNVKSIEANSNTDLVFEFASIDLTLVHFTLKKGTEVQENYVF